MITHQSYPSDVSDAEWEFVAPYLSTTESGATRRWATGAQSSTNEPDNP